MPVVKLCAIPVLDVHERAREVIVVKGKKEFSIRLEPALYRRLEKEAKRSGWTLNAEITKRLEASFIAADSVAFADAALLQLEAAMYQYVDAKLAERLELKEEKASNG